MRLSDNVTGSWGSDNLISRKERLGVAQALDPQNFAVTGTLSYPTSI